MLLGIIDALQPYSDVIGISMFVLAVAAALAWGFCILQLAGGLTQVDTDVQRIKKHLGLDQ